MGEQNFHQLRYNALADGSGMAGRLNSRRLYEDVAFQFTIDN